jgi:hypothetical protein
VYRLLDVPCRDRSRVYATAKAHEAHPGGIYSFSRDPPGVQNMLAMVQEAGPQVGPDGGGTTPWASSMTPPLLIQVVAAVEPYGVLRVEEPAVPSNIDEFENPRQTIRCRRRSASPTRSSPGCSRTCSTRPWTSRSRTRTTPAASRR